MTAGWVHSLSCHWSHRGRSLIYLRATCNHQFLSFLMTLNKSEDVALSPLL
jgi:hypothetical protein